MMAADAEHREKCVSESLVLAWVWGNAPYQHHRLCSRLSSNGNTYVRYHKPFVAIGSISLAQRGSNSQR
jgi:hypothetical protein